MPLSQDVTLVIQLDNLLHNQHPSFHNWSSTHYGECAFATTPGGPEPMQLGKTRVPPEEGQCWLQLQLIKDLQLPTTPCTMPLKVTAVNNQSIWDGYFTHQTVSITLQVGLFHVEELVL